MTAQDRDASGRRRAHPLRWLLALLVGLALFLPLVFNVLPRFLGGLLGDGGPLPDGWSGEEPGTEIVWIPNPRREEPETPAEPPPPSPSEPETAPAEAAAEAVELPAPASDAASGAEADGASAEAAGAALPTAGAGPGGGAPPGEGRRSPRILYQEWPSQAVLAALDDSGRFRFRLRVESDGSVSAWEILERFDCEPCMAEALRIVETLRFAPGTLRGEPVTCWVPYTIEFQRQRR
jgi:outer membrane biosynthesis protein TonB